MTNARPTIALVLETNNLRGGDASDAERATASLARLLRHLRAQTRPLASLREMVITHDGLTRAQQDALVREAGRALAFVHIDADAGYYDAKNLGFDATSADVVVFGDADCWPDPAWLEHLARPFETDPGTRVVAGRTTYRDDVLGVAATSMDFLYFDSRLADGAVRNFYANNVAFRREVFAAHRYRPAADIYRGHCQQLGLRLHAAGIALRYAPLAHTVHRFPDGARELVRLRMLRGADTCAMAPHLARSALPRALHWVGAVPVASPLVVLSARLAFSARALARERGPRRIASVATMCGLSAIDAAGVLARSVLGRDLGVRDGGLARDALGYHADGDALRAGARDGSFRVDARASSDARDPALAG